MDIMLPIICLAIGLFFGEAAKRKYYRIRFLIWSAWWNYTYAIEVTSWKPENEYQEKYTPYKYMTLYTTRWYNKITYEVCYVYDDYSERETEEIVKGWNCELFHQVKWQELYDNLGYEMARRHEIFSRNEGGSK